MSCRTTHIGLRRLTNGVAGSFDSTADDTEKFKIRDQCFFQGVVSRHNRIRNVSR